MTIFGAFLGNPRISWRNSGRFNQPPNRMVPLLPEGPSKGLWGGATGKTYNIWTTTKKVREFNDIYSTWKVDGATPMYWYIMAPY